MNNCNEELSSLIKLLQVIWKRILIYWLEISFHISNKVGGLLIIF